MNTEFCSCLPVLTVRDVPAALRFFADKLGFSQDFVWGTPVRYAGMHRGGVCIHLAHESNSRQKPGSGNICILANEVDAYHATCKERGVEILVPPGDRDYGLRDFALRDPDGNVLNVGCEVAPK